MGMETIALASLVISAGQAVMSYQAAEEGAAMSRRNADMANNAAWANYNNNKNILDQQATEIAQDANNQQSERAIQALVERSKMRAVAGEAGIAGNSVDRWFQDSEMQESKDIQSIQTNKTNKIRQNRQEVIGQYSQAQGRSNEAYSKVTSGGNLLGTGLQIASAGLDYKSKTNKLNGVT